MTKEMKFKPCQAIETYFEIAAQDYLFLGYIIIFTSRMYEVTKNCLGDVMDSSDSEC